MLTHIIYKKEIKKAKTTIFFLKSYINFTPKLEISFLFVKAIVREREK